VGEDITANFFLLALDGLYVSKHTFRLETLSKFGYSPQPSEPINKSAEARTKTGSIAMQTG
jgi:hypothetical protein